jgi:hypothetical protein
LGVITQLSVRHWSPAQLPESRSLATPMPLGAPIPADEAVTDQSIRFYSERVRLDPRDSRSQNTLSEYYLQRVRETGNEDYLPMAVSAARASLAAVSAARNLGGLTTLAHAEFSNHAFASARARARVSSARSEQE